MVAINKTRKALPISTKNYIATIKTLGSPPRTASDDSFLEENFLIDGSLLSPTTPASEFHNIPIGFSVTINGKVYKSFTASMQGYIVLQNYAMGNLSDYTQYCVSANNYASKIRYSFGYDHILLAPWRGGSNTNIPVLKNIEALNNNTIVGYYSMVDSTVVDEVNAGTNNKKWPISSVDRGLRYKVHQDEKGKCLLVRWTSTAYRLEKSYKFKFEVCVYENGDIEYRYWPLEEYEFAFASSQTGYISMAVGAFWPAQSSERLFRDFSNLLGYRAERNHHLLGGYGEYDASQLENSQPFSNAMNETYWPKQGAIISFSAPRRMAKFLPKKSLNDLDMRSLEPKAGLFDDQKTIRYGGVSLLSMPSTLPAASFRYSGAATESIKSLLNLSSSIENSIFVTGSVNKNAIDNLLLQASAFENRSSVLQPFNESIHDFSATRTDNNFFSTGSSFDTFGPAFSDSLRNKKKIELNFPVEKNSIFPTQEPAAYYYDKEKKQWIMIDSGRSTKTLYSSGLNRRSIPDYVVTETSLGFDAVGRRIVNGAGTTGKQSDTVIGSVYNYTSDDAVSSNIKSSALTKNDGYPLSLTDSKDYYPSKFQQLNVDVDYPFLIEKIVAEIPICAENDWFGDVTTLVRPLAVDGTEIGFPVGPIDLGGPALTFAVCCPKKCGESSYFDIIASGTITHMLDNMTGTVCTPYGTDRYGIYPVGFNSFSTPTAVIQSDGALFKDKVRLEMEPSVGGGLIFAKEDRYLFKDTQTKIDTNRSKARELLTTPQINIPKVHKYVETCDWWNNYTDIPADDRYIKSISRVYIQQVSPLSRGTTKVEFSGNSILGGVIASSNPNPLVKNPLYIGSLDDPKNVNFLNSINKADFSFFAVSTYSNVNYRPSPYLIFPGDSLCLVMSKTRPALYTAEKISPMPPAGGGDVYGNYTLTGVHDYVSLDSGNIRITLYGSYVKEGEEYNP